VVGRCSGAAGTPGRLTGVADRAKSARLKPTQWRRMHTEIEVRNVFNVQGRGAVAVVYLRQGTVRVGQQTRPPGAGPHAVLTVAAVEPLHAADGGPGALGLVFRERPSVDDLRTAFVAGTLLRFDAPAEP